jgi:hypothetical protein
MGRNQIVNKELEEQYIKGYTDYPETPEEVEWVLAAGLAVLAEEPWEESDKWTPEDPKHPQSESKIPAQENAR